MAAKLRIPPTLSLSRIQAAKYKQLYIAELDGSLELAVGFRTRNDTDENPITGLLFLSGDSFGKTIFFVGEWQSEIPSIRVTELEDSWESSRFVIYSEKTEEAPQIGSLGLLRHREKIDVFVREGNGRNLMPLYIELSSLRCHPSEEPFVSRLKLIEVESSSLVHE